MRKYLLISLLIIVSSVVFFILGRFSLSSDTHEFSILPTPVPTPLAKYAISELQKKQITPASFEIDDTLKSDKKYTSSKFTMKFDPALTNQPAKTVTGVINMPNGDGPFPLVLMIRGYVDPTIYQPGVGSQPAGSVFASNGYITVAPDFLGYAGSDTEAGNIFESRFQTYTTALTLLNTVPTPAFAKATAGKWDGKNIFLWAHSNGGQIALTLLSITGEPIPTVLWAPVSKPFPYNVLYYTDESADGGKLIRRELAKFENIYDTDLYSFTNYLEDIKAPIEFEQGTADDAVQFEWTRSISSLLKKQGLDITYNEYPGSDHNLRPAWNKVVENDLAFFKKHLK